MASSVVYNVNVDSATYNAEQIRAALDVLAELDPDSRADIVQAINQLPLIDRRVLALVVKGNSQADIARKVYGTRQRDKASKHIKRACSTVARLLNGEQIPGVNAPGKRRGRPYAYRTDRA